MARTEGRALKHSYPKAKTAQAQFRTTMEVSPHQLMNQDTSAFPPTPCSTRVLVTHPPHSSGSETLKGRAESARL